MGEVVKTKGDAKAEPADIVAAEQKKREEKSKKRNARKKAAAEGKKKEKEEELKKQRKDQLQQVNSIRNKDHHNRQLTRLHHVTPAPPPPPIKANVPTAPISCAKMVPISGADASKKSDKVAATRSLVTPPLDTFPVLKMTPISSADASKNIDINQDVPVTSVSGSTGSEERSFFVGRILVRISSPTNQTKTNDPQTNDNVRLEFGKDTDQGTIMCSQINKDNNNAAASTNVPGTTTVTNQLVDELDMKEKQVVSDAKTTMNLAKNNDDDDDDKFEEARGKKLIRTEQIALNAEATEKTQNQAERKKTQAIRKKGYNKFSVLLEESENEEQDIDRAAEEAATIIEEKPHDSEKEQDIEARRADEAATTAKKKREKRERKKKRKVVATTIEEKSHESGSDAQSSSSVGVVSLALICFLSLTAFYMS